MKRIIWLLLVMVGLLIARWASRELRRLGQAAMGEARRGFTAATQEEWSE